MSKFEHHALDIQWQACKQVLSDVLANDAVRRERVRVCFLEGDKEILECQLVSHVNRICRLESLSWKLRDSLDAERQDNDALRFDLLSRSSDLNNLKAELFSVKESTKDFKNSVLDRASVSELSNLRSEIELLRSQENTHKKALSEMKALQLQLSSVEIELESERRENNKRHQVYTTGNNSDTSLKARLDQEIRTRQDLEKETSRAIEEQQREKYALQHQLKTFQKELQDAKEKLQNADDRIANAPERGRSSKNVSFDTRTSQNKPSLVEISANIDLPTPNAGMEGLKARHQLTEFGLQSDFSTTPFIRKTDKLPMPSGVTLRESFPPEWHKKPDKGAKASHSDGNERNQTDRRMIMNKASESSIQQNQNNLISSNESGACSTGQAVQALNEVHSPPTDSIEPGKLLGSAPMVNVRSSRSSILKSKRSAGDTSHEELVSKKKRKRIGGGLGKTIFDDEAHIGPRDTELGLSLTDRSVVGTSSSNLTSTKSRGKNFLNGFSPLKRNRGATGA